MLFYDYLYWSGAATFQCIAIYLLLFDLTINYELVDILS